MNKHMLYLYFSYIKTLLKDNTYQENINNFYKFNTFICIIINY